MRLFPLAALLLAAPLVHAQDTGLDATYRTFSLDEGFTPDPWSYGLTAGGSVSVDLGECSYGTVAEAPDAELTYSSSGGSTLYIYATSGSDTTILVNTAGGQWVCNDDGYGDGDPIVVIRNAPAGVYDIWVGTYGSDTTPATLYVSEIDPR